MELLWASLWHTQWVPATRWHIKVVWAALWHLDWLSATIWLMEWVLAPLRHMEWVWALWLKWFTSSSYPSDPWPTIVLPSSDGYRKELMMLERREREIEKQKLEAMTKGPSPTERRQKKMEVCHQTPPLHFCFPGPPT